MADTFSGELNSSHENSAFWSGNTISSSPDNHGLENSHWPFFLKKDSPDPVLFTAMKTMICIVFIIRQ